MRVQNQVTLGIGSNIGDKKLNIEQCVAMIHENVATVVITSRLYESPAWGFDGDVFYNCAVLVHTHLSASEILEKILDLEIILGRNRAQLSGYESRRIDIDILSFNNDIISSEKLSVPHPQMQNRLFVLLPFKDLQSAWIHPVFNKNITELIAATSDQSSCVAIDKIASPFDTISLGQYNYIAIEGNIGAGKTTLVNKIADDFNAKTVLERFADNPFLPKFYEDQMRFAFPLEMSFLADRYQQISDDLAQFDLFKDFIVADYHIFKSLIFAKVTLTEDEYRLYRKLFEIIYKEMKKPDLYIYLYQNTERLLQNIKLRGRDYEQNITTEYLDKINHGYLDYIKSQPELNVLIIDVSDRDFVRNQHDYTFILEQIRLKSF